LKGHKNIQVETDFFADTDHSKYCIFDQGSVIFGGMNIADEYHLQWHDYMVLLKGPQLTGAFANKVLQGLPWSQNSAMVLAVNDREATEIRTAMVKMIDRALESVIVEHAYFSDDRVIAALRRAAGRGLRVEVILPKVPDTHLYANMATVNRLLEAEPGGAPRVHLYPHMSHAKVIMTDGRIAAVGSANLTPRSMLTSKEITLFVHGAPDLPFLGELRAQLDIDKAVSEEVAGPFELGLLDKAGAVSGKYVW
jgi:cardiolipin synthase